MYHRNAGRWLACFVLIAGGIRAPDAAAETLTLARALERVAGRNPTLAEHASQAESARARAATLSLAPPFTLTTGIENVAGGRELRGFDSAETTVQLTRVVELGGKRAGRESLGDAEIQLADHAWASARLDALALATNRFVEVIADQEHLALATERVRLAERTRREVSRVVSHARNPETDLRMAEIALAEAELEQEHAEHELRAARVSLAATWGAREPDFDQASLAWDVLPDPEALETLAARLPGSSSLRGLMLEADAAGARKHLAEAEAHPDLAVSLGVRRLEAFGDQGLVMSVSLPLGSQSRARHAWAQTQADLAAIEHRRAAAELDGYQQLFEQYQELGHARAEFLALSDTMIPKARAALEIATRGFELGRFPFLTLSQAQETLFELRRRRIDAAIRHHRLQAGMRRLVAATESP